MTKKTILLIFVLVGAVVAIYFMRDFLNIKEFFSFSEFATSTESASPASTSGQLQPTQKGFGGLLELFTNN